MEARLMAQEKKVPGTIYLNGRRYWWKVRLPGEKKPRARPLKPRGAAFATKDRAVAERAARGLWQAAVEDVKQNVARPRTVTDLVAAYTAYARIYYKPKPGVIWQ